MLHILWSSCFLFAGHTPYKTDKPIWMPFLGADLGGPKEPLLGGVHVGATRRKGLIDLQGAAVRHFPLLLWPLVLFA